MRGIRGATTIHDNSALLIQQETVTLFQTLMQSNNLQPDDVVSVLISGTPDVNSGFPAKAIRELQGCEHIPVMCFQEMDVPGALPLCIRLMVHANIDVPQQAVQHIYLNGAVVLRPDLAKNKS
ncbi:MAG: chorismate mutase [Bacilli bacterium]